MKQLLLFIFSLLVFSAIAQNQSTDITIVKLDSSGYYLKTTLTYEDNRTRVIPSSLMDSIRLANRIEQFADERARAIRELRQNEIELQREFNFYDSMLGDFTGQTYRQKEKAKVEREFTGFFILISVDSLGRNRQRLKVDENKLLNNEDNVFCRFNVRNNEQIVLRGGILNKEIVLTLQADRSYRGEDEEGKYILRR